MDISFEKSNVKGGPRLLSYGQLFFMQIFYEVLILKSNRKFITKISKNITTSKRKKSIKQEFLKNDDSKCKRRTK